MRSYIAESFETTKSMDIFRSILVSRGKIWGCALVPLSHPELRVVDLSILVLVNSLDHVFNFLSLDLPKMLEDKPANIILANDYLTSCHPTSSHLQEYSPPHPY